MAHLNLREIENYLVTEGVIYELFNVDYNLKVTPANFRNKIQGGLYHVSKEFNGSLVGIEKSIIVCSRRFKTNNTLIVVDNPQLVHYKLTHLFVVEEVKEIHPTAIIHPEAKIGKNVNIGPYSVIGKCEIEDNVNIQSHVVITDKVLIKRNAFIDSNSNIGQTGIVWVWDENGHRVQQAQIGGVIIGENVHLGTDITIVRGSLSESTIIGKGSVIAHGTKIGHGAHIGEMVHMANNVSLAGNTTIGNRCYLGSGSVVPSNITIPNNVIVGASAMVNKNFDEEYITLVGVPAKILYKENYNRKGRGTPIPHK
jgi:UDP-3-O-[3-hydroxymyristoyl] glucosamine N-acyltransferase